jgi:glycerophosphoryl diester phosphodiesterase
LVVRGGLAITNPWIVPHPITIAHRGGAAEAPENTLRAFHAGLEAGCEGIEFDLHVTADREIVVIHDPTVDRTTDGTGRVSEMSLEEVRSLHAGWHFSPGRGTAAGDDLGRSETGHRSFPLRDDDADDLRVPTLREVLAAFPGVPMVMEVKEGEGDEAYVDEVAEVLAEFERSEDVVVGSFRDPVVAAFRRRAPDVSTSLSAIEVGSFWAAAHGVGDEPVGSPGELLTSTGRVDVASVPPRWEDVEVLTDRFVRAAHEAELAVQVWTIDEPSEMRRVVRLGVDAIMTDRPGLLVETLG